jgi:2-polyprenyl-3-methyl-5-hydroxy-6-metoxy-1,4-benzoquinol methylase
MNDHDQALASAFDGQAAKFERAPVQSDPVALERLVRFADFPPDSLVLDAGCGPGLVSAALLTAGHRVVGVDLSTEMIARAQGRCAAFGGRARFVQTSLYDPALEGPFDGSISRYVLHHVADPTAFVARQVALVRYGGIVVLSDHSTDTDTACACFHEELERARDRTHVRNFTSGALVDLLAGAGLVGVMLVEEAFALDFDEWFDRGTPASPKDVVRGQLVAGPRIRGFWASPQPDQSLRIDCFRALVRGQKPEA